MSSSKESSPAPGAARFAGARRALALAAGVLAAIGGPSPAHAQQTAEGFALERLYLSAPGGGWFVMDSLDMRGGLGGAMSLTTGYAHDPLQVRPVAGPGQATIVSDEAFADFGFAATYDRMRLYLDFDVPLAVTGPTGSAANGTDVVGGYRFTPPGVDPASHPDSLSDIRVGFDARLLGGPKDPLRLGASAQLFVPNGQRADYDTDGTFRAMVRVLVAGDRGPLTYAAHVGVHVRPLDDAPAPGSPQGSELLFGVAEGLRAAVLGPGGAAALIVGPEAFGATALRSLFGPTATSLEALLTGRLEGTADDGAQLRVKLGAGIGIDRNFGTPDWRVVLGVELFDHASDRDHDGISDGKDACPDAPGPKTKDPKTSGCPAAPDGHTAPLRDPMPRTPGGE